MDLLLAQVLADARAPLGATPVLAAIVTVAGGFDPQAIADGLAAALPGVPVVGVTSAGDLSSRLVLPDEAGDDGWWAGPVEADTDAPGRARRVVDSVLQRHGGTDAVVGLVTHGHFSQFLLRAVLGIPTMTGWVDILNTSVTRFADVDVPGRTCARWINRVAHLAPGEVTD